MEWRGWHWHAAWANWLLLGCAFACADCEDTGLLQTASRPDALWAHEIFAGVSLYEVMSTCPESSVGISQGCWNSRFDLFDHNRDGLISAQDLSKTTAAGKNFTRQELQAGVAMAARWFPEEAGRLITHAPLITELALSEDLGKMGLDKVPAPNDPLPKLPPASPLRRARLRRRERGGGSALAALSPECLQGSVDVAASTLSLTFNILGMTLPNGKLVADILQGNNVVVESIVDTVHEKQEATDNLSIAQKVWQVFQILHDEGIFTIDRSIRAMLGFRCRPRCGNRVYREGSEELDLEKDEPFRYAKEPEPSASCLAPCRAPASESFGEELLNPGDTVPYEAANKVTSHQKLSLPDGGEEDHYVQLASDPESPGHEAERLLQDLAHVKASVGHLNKLVGLLGFIALTLTLGLLVTGYAQLGPGDQALARRYALLASIPVVALLFTWFHIWLAIQMMFLPLNFVGLWQYGSSGMGVGWQGLVPRKCEKMARMSYKCARPYLEGPRDWLGRVDSRKLMRETRQELRQVIDGAMAHVLKKYYPRTDYRMPASMRSRLTDQALDQIQETAPELWNNFTDHLCHETYGIDNDGMIVKVFTENKELLNEFFLRLGDREFRFIEHCGAAMGFVCGLLQLVAFNNLSPEGRSIFLPVTGFLLGIVTNWLAILMVFKPTFPVPIKIFKYHLCDIQGLFLKRQPEVCVLYSKMLKDNFLSFNKIVGYLQTQPELWERLKLAYTAHSTKVLRETLGSSATWFAEWTIGQQGYKDMEEDLKSSLLDGLHHAHQLHKVSSQYISQVTDIENRNRECLQRMPPNEFENLLHPVFQEDEWILILLGGVLGAIVGEVLKASLADMDWWHFSVAVARAGATVASWYASGAALLVLQLALAVPNAVDLVQGLKAVHDQSLLGFWLPVSIAPQADEILQKVAASTGLAFGKRQIRAARALHAFFPLRSQLSFMIAPMKVYPAAQRDPSFPRAMHLCAAQWTKSITRSRLSSSSRWRILRTISIPRICKANQPP
ncbi:unnamed protein product [Effrenium voratum]|uniref:EF-hand domain-containing protein n=1 Tax=Effrenium voratum TaxID=2562239 RepID=A0AA36IW16_9DINO|nr:unnamed protein product [Effrenium voratum]